MKKLKIIGEGMASKAFIDDESYILLVGKRNDSFNIYKDLKANMDLLEGKIKSVRIPSKLKTIEPCEKYPFGALTYLGVPGSEIKMSTCTAEQKKSIGKKLTEFLWEMHNNGLHWNKEKSVKHENDKAVRNLKLLEPYFTKEENEHLQKVAKQYDKFLRESDYIVTHGDLHEENILVNERNELTGIIDFGNMAYTPVEFDFAPIYRMDSEIWNSVVENYPKPIDIEKVKLSLYFRGVTFFEYVQGWSKEAILKEIQDIKNTGIFDGMKGLTYRNWTESDLSELEKWFADDETSKRLGGMLPLDKLYKNVSKLKNQSNLLFFDSGVMIGKSTIEKQGDRTNIDVLINPACRGKGYGKKIINKVIELCKSNKIYAHIEKDNAASIGLFEKCGFISVEEDEDGLIKYLYTTLEEKLLEIIHEILGKDAKLKSKIETTNNSVFVVEKDEKEYILKLYKHKTWPEDGKVLAVNKWLSEAGINHPKVIAYNKQHPIAVGGYIIEEKIKGVPIQTLEFDEKFGTLAYTKLAKLAKQIHAIELSNFGWLNDGKWENAYYEKFSEYIKDETEEKFCKMNNKSDTENKKLFDKFMVKLQQFDYLKPGLGHGDFSMRNIIFNDEDLTLIDWDDVVAMPWMADIARLTFDMMWEYDEHYDLFRTAFLKEYLGKDSTVAFDEFEKLYHIVVGLDWIDFSNNVGEKKEFVEKMKNYVLKLMKEL